MEVGEEVALLGGAGLGGVGGEVRGNGVVEKQVALGHLSTNGAAHASPGQRPGFGHPTAMSPVGAGHRAARDELERPFRAQVILTTGYAGRCPGLVWGRAFGPQEARSGAGSGFGSGKWDTVRMPAHGFLPSMRLISRSKSEM